MMRQQKGRPQEMCGGIVPLESLLPRDEEDLPLEVALDPRDAGREVGTQIAATGAPVEMLAAVVRAYVVALLRKPDARTAEDRSRIASSLRAVLDDAILDGFREARPPEAPTLPPGKSPRLP